MQAATGLFLEKIPFDVNAEGFLFDLFVWLVMSIFMCLFVYLWRRKREYLVFFFFKAEMAVVLTREKIDFIYLSLFVFIHLFIRLFILSYFTLFCLLFSI